MVAVGISVIGGDLLYVKFKWIPMWVSMIALFAPSCWVYARFFTEKHQDTQVPITVQDLGDAATSGKWVKHYDTPVASLFRTLE